MDIMAIPGKLMDGAEKNMTLLSFVGTSLGRASEMGGDAIANTFNLLNPLQNPTQGGPLYEVMHTFKSLDDLKWKLWSSPHLPTTVFKLGAGVVAFDYFIPGIVPAQWKNIAKKAATGALAAAIVLPGSSPEDPNGLNDPIMSQVRESQEKIRAMYHRTVQNANIPQARNPFLIQVT